jgi:serine/threonine protein kinase
MAAPVSAPDFIDLLKRSKLIPEDRIARAVQGIPGGAATPPIDRLATAFVRAGLITKFQARQLAQGRYKRFTIADKYLLLEHIGTGGMGAVYLCEHMLMRRLCAVKVLPVDKIASDPSALERFFREARAVAALDHPNIVQAYDIDKFDQVHYLVMEYVDGTSLQEIVTRGLARNMPFPVIRAVHAIAQAAAGLQHAHELGLIHRDIKPGNLLLDRTGTIKVLDLGLARFFDHRHDGLTKRFDDNCVLGTADYLSPEQATMVDVDARADIYGLGGTLYFLLTGSSPFPTGSVAQKLVAHQVQKPKPVSDFRSDVPAELLAILETMMAKDPAERYPNCLALLEALEPWTSEPIDPPPSHEMPDHCPAVLGRMEAAGAAGRSSITKSISGVMRALPRSGSGILRPLVDQASVPTGRSTTTTPIHRTSNEPNPAHRTPRLWPLLLAVALGSFLLATVLVTALFVFVVR